jgi:hypothetical protein
MTEQSLSQQQWCGLPRAGAMLRGPAEDGRPPHPSRRRARSRPSICPRPPRIAQENRRYTDHRLGMRYSLINRPRNRCNSITVPPVKAQTLIAVRTLAQPRGPESS